MEKYSENLPQKRSLRSRSSPKPEYFFVSGLSSTYEDFKKSKDLLKINHKFPRSEKQEYFLLFSKIDPSSSSSLSKFIDSKCIITKLSPLKEMSLSDILQSYKKFDDLLNAIHIKVKKERAMCNNVDTFTIKLPENQENIDLISTLKQEAHRNIGEMFISLEKALNLLTVPRDSQERHIEDDDQCLLTLIFFYITWFILNRIDLNQIDLFKKFVLLLEFNILQRFTERFSLFDKITKSLILDLIIQVMYFPNEFTSPHNIMKFILFQSDLSIPIKPKLMNFKKILTSKLVLGYFTAHKHKSYRRILDTIFESTYRVSLPNDILALTLFDRYIIINEEIVKNIESNVLKETFYLVSFLHELENYMIRSELNCDKKWIEFSTPREKCSEAGNYIETYFFGSPLKYISVEASEFILNYENWNRPLNEFVSDFIKKNHATDEEVIRDINSKRFFRFKIRSSRLNFLGHCPRAYTNRHLREETKDHK